MVLVKAYGSFYPANQVVLEAVQRVLADWYIGEAVELDGDLLRISHEGEYFPAEEVVDALRPFMGQDKEGKLDFIDLEAWTLRRFLFHMGGVSDRSASLDQALESCQR